MKIKSTTICLLLMFFFGLSTWLPPSAASSKSIKWFTYDEGMRLGKSENKKVFLHFYATWCKYCKIMENETFQDASVVSYLNENFISIKVDTTKEKKLSSDYGVRGLPATWFIAENGEEITKVPGYIRPKMLVDILKYINTDNYKKMTFKEFVKGRF